MQAWEWALELRTELEEWWASPRGRQFGQRWNEIKAHPSLGQDISEVEILKLGIASPFYITTEMCDLLQHAQQTFPATPLRAVDLPSDAGFVFMAKPMMVTDIHIKNLPWQAFAWGLASRTDNPSEATAVHLSVYAHRDNDPDRADSEANSGTFFAALGLTHETAWGFDEDYSGGDTWKGGTVFTKDNEIAPEALASGMEMLRTIHTFFILSQQLIPNTSSQQASRPVRKRHQRAFPGRPIPDVRVVELRRKRPPRHADEEINGGREYSHQWWVNGHWRRQWYPSEGRHKPKYIVGYVKGPEDKPFQAKDTAYIWRR